MNKITGQNISFYGVSINTKIPTINTKIPTEGNMSPAQAINWGWGELNRRSDPVIPSNKCFVIEAQRQQNLRKVPNLPVIGWLTRRLEEGAAIKKKRDVNKREKVRLQEAEQSVFEMGGVVAQVKDRIAQYNGNSLEHERCIRDRDSIERLRVANTAGSGGFSTMAGYDSEKNILRKYFISRIKREEAKEETSVPGSVLFFGPTGNGKTTFAKAFANETGCELVQLMLGLSKNKYNTFMKTLMDEAQKSEEKFQKTGKRTIIFIDEFTKVSHQDSPINGDLAKFLRTCSDKYHCTVFAAANDPLKIKMPITGSKNIFPYIISLDPPNKENKTKVLQYYLKDRLPEDTDFGEMANYMENIEGKLGRRFNIAQIQATMEAGQEKNLKIEDVYKQIDQMEPALDSKYLARYNEAVDKLMVNQVNE